ncbi:MAG: sugar kinase [Planctomycetes bacterium]|nr:sugar kinase [Planctomycetota bacterium]MCC7169836.1 sugar kinase [Planctomycetota bacterium]
MTVLVVGTMAFDSVETPFGKVDHVLGGSATYFSYSASFFTPVRLVSVIGNDFRQADLDLLKQRSVDLAGVQHAAGKTFSWSGKYEGDMNAAQTLDVNLNVYGDFKPQLPAAYKDSRFVFLANGSPASQMMVLDQVTKPEFVVADTMNLWIETAQADLRRLLTRIDALILNDGEARMLAREQNLVAAGEKVLTMGPRLVIIKKGEHGSFLLTRDGTRFAIPAFPVSVVKDPTGAGDSFAGGVVGFLAREAAHDDATVRRAMVYGTVMASFVVEDFSLESFKRLSAEGMKRRYDQFVKFISL